MKNKKQHTVASRNTEMVPSRTSGTKSVVEALETTDIIKLNFGIDMNIQQVQLPEGWKIKKLGEVCDFENGDRGKNYPNKSHRVSLGIPFINAGHLNDNRLDFSEMDYISV